MDWTSCKCEEQKIRHFDGTPESQQQNPNVPGDSVTSLGDAGEDVDFLYTSILRCIAWSIWECWQRRVQFQFQRVAAVYDESTEIVMRWRELSGIGQDGTW